MMYVDADITTRIYKINLHISPLAITNYVQNYVIATTTSNIINIAIRCDTSV